MSHRILAIKIITRRNLLETIYNPGLYITISACLLMSFFLISGFSASVGSSGFMPGAHPLYDIITRALGGIFGETMVNQIFSAGPFLFILFTAFLPFLIYLSISSLYKTGTEKQSGAFELIVYGPADITSCYLAALIRNIVLTAVYLVLLLVCFLISAVVYNIVPDPLFYYSLVLLFFTAAAVQCYTVIISAILDNTASAIILFLAGMLVFGFLQISSYALIPGYVKGPAGIIGLGFQWFSPFYYWSQGLDAAGYGRISLYLLNILLLLILSCSLLLISHMVLKRKGVRA